MPRNAETERPRIVAKIRAYLERANADASLGLTQEDIASGAKVAKRHFSRRDHPDFVALADEIAAARRARTPTPPPPEQPASSSCGSSPEASTSFVLKSQPPRQRRPRSGRRRLATGGRQWTSCE